MALSPRLELRQGQSLVITPQLQQAIKLLQLSNLELADYVEQELERNPLLERDEREHTPEERQEKSETAASEGADEALSREDFSRLRKLVAAKGTTRGEEGDGHLDFVMPEHGAATQVWAAVSPELDGRGGLYLEDCGINDAPAPYACDEQRAADFWTLSEQLCAQ